MKTVNISIEAWTKLKTLAASDGRMLKWWVEKMINEAYANWEKSK